MFESKGGNIMDKKTTIISVAIQKGGVGKTTSTVNLGAALFYLNKKVLVIDLDPQMSLSTWLGTEDKVDNTICDLLVNAMMQREINVADSIRKAQEGFDYIPAYLELAIIEPQFSNALRREYILSKVLRDPVIQTYDYVLIDCLPSLGTLLVNALTASDYVLIPVQPQKLSIEALRMFSSSFQTIKENLNEKLKVIGILPTMVDNTLLSSAGLKNLRANYGNIVFDKVITKRIEASETTLLGKSSVSKASSKIGQQYLEIAKEIIERVGGNKHE